MNIVILDGYTANPGDLSWSEIEALGSVTLYERTLPQDVLSRSQSADIILTNKVVLDRVTLEQLPSLKYIGVLATGYNVVDVDTAKKKGVIVTNIPSYSTNSVAQLVFGFILELTHSIGSLSTGVHKGEWAQSQDFSYWHKPLIELSGKTLGLVGYGTIAKKVIEIGQAFNMKIVVHTRTVPEEPPQGITFCSFHELLSQSDFITLHCPLTPLTEKLINKNSLSKMKTMSCIINTGRGPLIDELDLAHALNTGLIYGAGLDVLSQEPPAANNPLFNAQNCYITPHIAWASGEARARLLTIAAQNIKSFIDKNPVNVI